MFGVVLSQTKSKKKHLDLKQLTQLKTIVLYLSNNIYIKCTSSVKIIVMNSSYLIFKPIQQKYNNDSHLYYISLNKN